MISKVDLIAKAYENELIHNKNTPLKKGSFKKSGEKISFITYKNEPLVLNLDSNNMDIIEFFNPSFIQLNNDLEKFKKNVNIFAEKSKNKEYWNAVADLVDKCI